MLMMLLIDRAHEGYGYPPDRLHYVGCKIYIVIGARERAIVAIKRAFVMPLPMQSFYFYP